MNITLPLILCILSGLGTLLGSLLVFIPKINKTDKTALLLTISGTIMFELSIFELLPSNIPTIINNVHFPLSIILIIISFMLGVQIINILDKNIAGESSIKKIGILSFISLIIHNFPEGIATFMSSLIDIRLGIELGLAILLHNIPEGLCITLPYSIEGKKRRGVLLGSIASLAEPIGGLLGYILLKNYINEFTISLILIFVAGLMITLSINNIYKEAFKNKKQFLYGMIIGTIFIIITLSMH